LTALSVGPGPAESAMGPMGEIPHRGEIQVRPSCRGAPGVDPAAIRNPPNDFKLS
jgi:hypothetical protein